MSQAWTARRPSLLSFKDAFILRPVLNDESRVGLYGIIQLQDEEVFRISERLDHQRKNFRPQRDQSIEFLADRSSMGVGADRQPSAEPRFLPGFECGLKSGLDLGGNTAPLLS